MNDVLKESLRRAVEAYGFPAVTYDFTRGTEHRHDSMLQVEQQVRQQLVSSDAIEVRDGLSNVLYWGYARMGIRDVRVQRFREAVTHEHLVAARGLFHRPDDETLVHLGKVGLPQFSQVSFLSKVLMFLDPGRYVTLDLKLAKLRHESVPTVLHDLKVYSGIPASQHNNLVYNRWCETCRALAHVTAPSLRPVDVERGIFHLVDTGRSGLAAEMLVTA